MKLYCIYTLLTCFCLFWTVSLKAKTDSTRVQALLPYINNKGRLIADVLFDGATDEKIQFSIKCFRFLSATDTLFVFSRNSIPAQTVKGAQVVHNVISTSEDSAKLNTDFYDILKKTGSFPVGHYTIMLELKNDSSVRSYSFAYNIDSSLSTRSPLSQDVRNVLVPPENGLAGIIKSDGVSNNLAVLTKATRKMGRTFRRKGLDQSTRQRNGSLYFDLYYKGLYVGYYKLDTTNSIATTVNAERKKVADDAGSFAKNELEDIQSLFTQVRELNNNSKKDKEATGEIGLSTYVGTGQEEKSTNDNNYYELHGRVDVPVMQIPVSIEGFYTSQDQRRTIKASCIRLHYDTQKAKAELLKLINGYNEKYDNTVAKGMGFDAVYGTYLHKLEEEKSKALNDINKEYGINLTKVAFDTATLRRQLADSLVARTVDTAGMKSGELNNNANRAKSAADSASRLYQKALKKYEKVNQLQQSIDKYTKLIDQYKTTTHFDSSLVYDKVKDLKNSEDLSYKELSKKASGLLPEGKAKSFVTGLTHLDAGIFNKDVSSYTLSGQNIKGLDAGYDFGFCQAAFTIGRIEYAGRDGSLDKYTGYSARVSFKPVKGQKASIIYYGYTPSKKMLSDEKFFSDVDVSMPSFRSPVHIISLTYSGAAKKPVRYDAEAGTSFRKQVNDGDKNLLMSDKMAYKVNLEGDIPGTNATIDGGYEHAGKAFENNSAPVNVSGLERYHAGIRSAFFANFLSVDVEYNYLEQQSFSGKGGNVKWGFEVKTNSKRYPSVGLSYKPFATFRSLNDTLNIPQRPLVGEVWTGRASWQLKRRDFSLRFTAIYNKNSSELDTIRTETNVLQVNTIYLTKELSLMLNVARTGSSGSDTGVLHQATTMVSLNGSRPVSGQLNVNGGFDVGAAKFGMSRYAFNMGVTYRFRKIPLTVRAGGRYNTYRLRPEYAWRQLVMGSIDLLWQFKFKISD